MPALRVQIAQVMSFCLVGFWHALFIVYNGPGDESAVLAKEFSEMHNLSENMEGKLKELLDA